MKLQSKGTVSSPKIWWHKGHQVKWSTAGKLVKIVEDLITTNLKKQLSKLVNAPSINTPAISEVVSQLVQRKAHLESLA